MIHLRKLIQLTVLVILLILFPTLPTQAQPEPVQAWAKTINQSGTGSTGLLTSDNDGNTYVVVSINNTSITVGGTTITHTSSFGKYAIIKYDNLGNGIWIKEIPFVFQSSGNMNPDKLLYHNGKLYLFTCYRQNNIVMDGFVFPPYQAAMIAGDLVLIKMNANNNGNTEWIRTIARPGSTSVIIPDEFEVYADQDDNIHTVGTFSSGFIFHTGDTLMYGENFLHINAFHAIYDTLGNLKTGHTLGVNNTNPGNYSYEYFHKDAENNIYRFVKETKTFIKYNEQGDTLFTKTFTSGAAITGMVVDPWQNVFLSGYFSASTTSFDGISTSKTGGTTDAILVKFNSNDGTVQWLKNLGDPVCDRFDFINIDAIGNIYVLNEQYGSCATPGASMAVKYNNDGDIIWKKIINTHPGGNPALFPMVRAGNITPSPDGGTVIVTGSSQFAQNDTKAFLVKYGTCNTPQPTLTASNLQFCTGDSILLSVTETPGYNYLWSNGDTTNTAIYVSSSGKYSVIAIQDRECYAQSQEFYISENPFPDVTISQHGSTLTAVSGYSYQWLDCNSGYAPVNGENTNSFNPVQNGNYAVKVTSPAGCTDTSACFSINNVNIDKIELNQLISIYPNPATEEINIQSSLDIHSVRILDLQGKELIQTKGDKVTISSLSTGIYLIEITTAKGIGTKKFIKE